MLFRATWAVFPYSIVVLCWHGLALRAQQIFKAKAKARRKMMEGSSSKMAMARQGYKAATIAVINPYDDDDRESSENHERISLKHTTKQSSIEVSQASHLELGDEATEVASFNQEVRGCVNVSKKFRSKYISGFVLSAHHNGTQCDGRRFRRRRGRLCS